MLTLSKHTLLIGFQPKNDSLSSCLCNDDLQCSGRCWTSWCCSRVIKHWNNMWYGKERSLKNAIFTPAKQKKIALAKRMSGHKHTICNINNISLYISFTNWKNIWYSQRAIVFSGASVNLSTLFQGHLVPISRTRAAEQWHIDLI